MKRIHSLDGLRAVAVGLVIFGHAIGKWRAVAPLAASLGILASLGVRCFFVISGLLITTLILEEIDRTGRLHLGRFFARRVLRIFPAFYLYLGFIAIWSLLDPLLAISSNDLLYAATYTANYGSRSWYTGHSWSLAVEEQFYLLWPATLTFLSVSASVRVAFAFVVLGPACRAAMLTFAPAYYHDYGFESVGDALATGCLLAGYRRGRFRAQTISAIIQSRFFAALPVALLGLCLIGNHPSLYGDHSTVYATFANTFMNVMIALLIEWTLSDSSGVVHRLLNARAITWVGTMSYSLYLWQQPFLDPAPPASSAWWNTFPVNFFSIGACSLCSYYFIEKPMLRLRSKLRNVQVDAPDIPIDSSRPSSSTASESDQPSGV